jgi:L-alanine-DL-glutamate epimerase-like enolase superfamily enzyme
LQGKLKIEKIEKIPVIYHAVKTGWKQGDKQKYQAWPSEIPAVIVKIHANDGNVGIGEAVSQHWYYGSTTADMYKALSLYGEALVGEDPRNLLKVERLLEKTLAKGVPRVQPARDGLSVALYDLLGKHYDEPLYNLLGGAITDRFELQTNLYMRTPEEMAKEAKAYVQKGFAGLKVKCGLDVEEKGWSLEIAKGEVEKITAVLEAIPDTILIDADANQAWGDAGRTIRLVKGFGLDKFPNLSLEQPGRLGDLEGARRIRDATGLPVILDEAVYSPEIFTEIIRMQAADRVVLKGARVGGYFVTRKMIGMAEAAAIGVSLESGLGMIGDVAVCHLAATVDEPYPLEAETFTWVKENPVRKGGVVIEGGKALLGRGPGLGIELDDDVVERIRIKDLKRVLE